MKYRCSGDGFTEFKDTYQCLEQLKDCPGTPSNCTEANTYIQCMEEQAYKLCGSEARDFVCNVFDITVNVILSCPTLPKCSKTKAEQ
uniref:Uncharacterized protein n=1 Tax=Panagrolaimus davidi TaxID=227884 RepID=A0A914P1S4_9BILA